MQCVLRCYCFILDIRFETLLLDECSRCWFFNTGGVKTRITHKAKAKSWLRNYVWLFPVKCTVLRVSRDSYQRSLCKVQTDNSLMYCAFYFLWCFSGKKKVTCRWLYTLSLDFSFYHRLLPHTFVLLEFRFCLLRVLTAHSFGEWNNLFMASSMFVVNTGPHNHWYNRDRSRKMEYVASC